MNLRYGILADHVIPGRKKNIIGTIDVIAATKYPAVHRNVTLLIRLEAHLAEEGKHTIEVQFLDADGNRVGQGPPPMPFELRNKGRIVGHAPLAGEFVFPIEGLPLPKPGDYEFAILIDGRYIGGVPLYAVEGDLPPEAQ